MNSNAIEKVLVQGDMAALTESDRIAYYSRICESLGLNPLTQPFAYIKLNGKLVLYAKRECTEQLRRIHSVSISIIARELLDDIYVVTARATLPDGRTDESIGAVALPVGGEARANAIMKGETKAKRRVTLSICGLGLLDELEVETLRTEAVNVASAPVPPQSPEAEQAEPSSPTQTKLNDRDKIYEQIAQEMKRVNWSNAIGRDYLLKKYEKGTRAELDDHELMEFLYYLIKTTAVTQKS
jgi:hypothetical protein